ncbi:MAG TPA: hypothetical protein VEH06_12545 [Candidatus Bathyarchaeia archaeon]|nr:hypothetical protein [Candidatus Bathyarchaeia archaeon]
MIHGSISSRINGAPTLLKIAASQRGERRPLRIDSAAANGAAALAIYFCALWGTASLEVPCAANREALHSSLGKHIPI